MRELSLAALALPMIFAPACGDSFEGTEDEEEPRCEGDASVACNDDPWNCPVGQNCWIDGSLTYQCVAVGPSGAGEPCTLAAGGSPCEQDMGLRGSAGNHAGDLPALLRSDRGTVQGVRRRAGLHRGVLRSPGLADPHLRSDVMARFTSSA